MANIYKKPVVLTDPKTGKRVKTKSKKWWGGFETRADGKSECRWPSIEQRRWRCSTNGSKRSSTALLG